jgi:gliding motility-associated-like protein
MKKQLEDLFRESLEGHQMPYDPAAWKAVEKKLPPSGNSFLKIAIASAAAVTLVTVGYLLFDRNEPATTQVTEVIDQPETIAPADKESVEVVTERPSKQSDQQENVAPAKSTSPEPVQTIQPELPVKGKESTDQTHKQGEHPQKERTEIPTSPIANNSNWTKQALLTKIKPVQMNVCEGESVSLVAENLPQYGSVIWTLSNGKELIGERVQITPESYVVITPRVKNTATKEQVELEALTVHVIVPQKPVVLVTETMRNTKPYFIAENKSALKNVVWHIDGRSGEQNKFEFYLTEKGTYTLNIHGIDENGCKVVQTESISLQESYNLFAEKAFSPNGDGLNETFMPKALLSRNVEFRMTVHDRSGSLLFESNSTDKPWDGTTLNGEKARIGNYIWAISLINEEGLPEKYSGMIIITEN